MVNEPHLHPHQPPHDHDHEHEDESSYSSKYMILTIIIAILFSIFISSYNNYTPKLKHPTLLITKVEVPTFTVFSGSSTFSFTLTFYGSVINPTRAFFSYSTTSANLFHGGQQVGSMLIPGRRVASGMENFMEVSIYANRPVPVSVVGVGYIPVMGGLRREEKPTVEVELRMKPTKPGTGAPNDAAPLYRREASDEPNNTATNAAGEANTPSAFGFGYAGGGTPAQGSVKLESDRVLSKELHNSIEKYTSPLRPVHRNLLTACVNALQGNISQQDEQQCTSFNASEYVQQMDCDDLLSEVDSGGCDSSLRSVRGYSVKPESVGLLTSIFDKYGDIGAKCSMGSPSIRSFYMQWICDIVEKLKNCDCISLITLSEAEKMLVFLNDAENVCFDVGWLKRRVDQIVEGKQAFVKLKAPSELKRLHAEQKTAILGVKQKAEVYKKEVAIHQQQIDMHQQQIHGLQERVCTANSEVSVYEEEALKSGKAIAECKAKLRLVAELKPLAHGLL